ncbi:hypothetical protein V6259_11460 [Marinomonas sp. TI.3.20]|uniref:hypothetical protein n=1 Tax=Marinomonas sp. TI.3.20 TaxID=3121296 RepID=UPI00311FA723
MAKFCVFCGNKPESKTKEHVIPDWLINLTGDPKRIANFGFNKEGGPRRFSYDQFVFPACENCNNLYSDLERKAKNIFENVINGRSIPTEKLSLLFDWFDKVRVGIWLGLATLDKLKDEENVFEKLEPNFHINKRVGQFDRVLIIEKYKSDKLHLSFQGTDTYLFMNEPSVFSMMVNGVCFTNISSYFLLSRRVGFPYPSKISLDRNSDMLRVDIENGTCRVSNPIIRKRIKELGVLYAQPMFGRELVSELSNKYKNPYIKEHAIDYQEGIGNIYEVKGEKLVEYKSGDNIKVPLDGVYYPIEFEIRLLINVYEWQVWVNDFLKRDLSYLTKEQKIFVNKKIKLLQNGNRKRISYAKNKLKQIAKDMM